MRIIPFLSLRKLSDARQRLRGASMLEVAITIPVFLMVILGTIDIARYYFAYLVLSYAATSAADLASKLDVEVKTDAASCVANQTSCDDYIERVKRILNQADNIANLVSTRAPTTGAIVRQTFEHYYETPQQELLPPVTPIGELAPGAAFIRPGEKVMSSEGTEFNHPKLAFPGWPTAGSGETWGSLLTKSPLEIRIEASFSALTPFIGRIPISVRALSYRKTGQYGHAPRGYTPEPTYDPLCHGSSCPTPPPLTPPPTSSPSSSPSATPTPPPVVDCSCCLDTDSCGGNSSHCFAPPCESGGGLG